MAGFTGAPARIDDKRAAKARKPNGSDGPIVRPRVSSPSTMLRLEQRGHIASDVGMLNVPAYVHSVILFPALSVNAPTTIMMRSIIIQIPRPPKVKSCRRAVPVLPT